MKNVVSRIAVCGVLSLFAQNAMASDASKTISTTQPLPLSLMNYSGGNDWARYEIAPNWSRELGWSLRGAFGSYITNDLALGAIVEYGEGKREYLTNAGLKISNDLSFIGTIGLLEEHREFVADAGKETVQQMEYGASLKSAYDIGMFRGFELNGYLADANSKNDDIETGKLYGTQILTNLYLSYATRIRFGGGYEWLQWDEGEDNNAVSFRADGTQKITNNLNVVANVKLGASEYVYGGGLNYNLDDRANSNVIGINYEHIEGKNGIQSDQRVQVSWTMGMGVGPNSQALSNGSKTSGKSNSLNIGESDAPANTLLADVMKRPEFLPKRVLARVGGAANACGALGDFDLSAILSDYGALKSQIAIDLYNLQSTIPFNYVGDFVRDELPFAFDVLVNGISYPTEPIRIDGGDTANNGLTFTYGGNIFDESLSFTFVIYFEGESCTLSGTAEDYRN